MKRHDTVCAEPLFNTCKDMWLKLDKEHWYKNVPKSVEIISESKVTVRWKEQEQTDRTNPDNKLDITVRDNEEGTCVIGCCNVRRRKWDQERS